MSLEAADKAMICQQVKHHNDLIDVDLQHYFHCWVLFKTLVDLHFLPNDGHEARKWSCGTSL